MPKSNAQKRATVKYVSTHYDQVVLRMPKGSRESLKEKAESEGKSVNEYILGLLQREIPKLKGVIK